MKKFNSVVTGGAGFIGSHLVEKLLKHNHKVTVLDNFSTGRLQNLKEIIKKIKIIKCDISKSKKLSKYLNSADYIFHLAGLADIVPSIQYPKKYYNANVVGTLNLLNFLNKKKLKKFVYAASASCYGVSKKYPISEKTKISTLYPYSFTKWSGENLVMHWKRVYNLKAVSLRFFNAYGPRSRTTGAYGAVFGIFLAQKANGKSLTIVGNGKQTRDFVHVRDLVDALYRAAIKGKTGSIYNVASGKEITVNKIANLIGGKKIFIPKRPGEPDRSLASISKIKKELGWKPKISIETGIKDLLRRISYWKHAPVWTPKKIKNATKIWFTSLRQNQ